MKTHRKKKLVKGLIEIIYIFISIIDIYSRKDGLSPHQSFYLPASTSLIPMTKTRNRS